MPDSRTAPNTAHTSGVRLPIVLVLVVVSLLAGALGMDRWHRAQAASAAPDAASTAKAKDDLAALSADVAKVKDAVPSQSHAMMDVGYHWTSLWFAAASSNWPLAQFYFDETRQHVRWTIRLRPIRKDPAGNPVDLKAIFDVIDSSTFEVVKKAIERKDHAQFEAAYKLTLEACYSCHKTSGRPYLRPMVPKDASRSIINVDPGASWPQ